MEKKEDDRANRNMGRCKRALPLQLPITRSEGVAIISASPDACLCRMCAHVVRVPGRRSIFEGGAVPPRAPEVLIILLCSATRLSACALPGARCPSAPCGFAPVCRCPGGYNQCAQEPPDLPLTLRVPLGSSVCPAMPVVAISPAFLFEQYHLSRYTVGCALCVF